jgi:hypothetical protein
MCACKCAHHTCAGVVFIKTLHNLHYKYQVFRSYEELANTSDVCVMCYP